MILYHFRKSFNKSVRMVLDTILPHSCLTCDNLVSDSYALCGTCWGELLPITPPVCARLGLPLPFDVGEDAVCALALADPPVFDRARAAVVYNDKARELVTGLKFRDALSHAPFMAQRMVLAGKDLLNEADLIVPVPLHWRRHVARQYNQSGMLARYIGKIVNKPVAHQWVKRKKMTRQQTGLDKHSRKQNVLNAFSVSRRHRALVHQKHIIVIDDVYTTGATVQEVTTMLRLAGAKHVDILSFARVVMDEAGFVSPELAHLDEQGQLEHAIQE